MTVTLTNAGSAPMSITQVATGGADALDFAGLSQNCTAMGTLDPGDSCSAAIAFRPTTTGTRTASLIVTDTAPRSPHSIALSGTGV
jgi:hypothetical protein